MLALVASIHALRGSDVPLADKGVDPRDKREDDARQLTSSALSSLPRQRASHLRVSFSCVAFWPSRSLRQSQSTRSRGWSWLKQEKTTVSSPVTGSLCRCRHCAQISFIMH